MEAIIRQILAQLNLRQDAKFTSSLDLQLEQLRSRTYDIKYPELRARRFIPVNTEIDPGAETHAYHQWDSYGMADIIANYADDITLVDELVEKFTGPIEGIAKGYQVSVQDLRRAAMSGSSIEARKARACRRAIELRIDDIGAVGNAKAKLPGFLNNANVTILTAATDGTSTRWVTGRSTPKAPALIKADMHTAVSTIWTTTKQVHQPNTILLPTVEYSHVSQSQVGLENQQTILKSFMDNNPSITDVDFWHKLDTADAAGTGPRMVTYQRDPEILELVIPQDFEQFPPQARNLAYIVPCHARIGGVTIFYPLAIVYTDGL
jgi:hypothetical protein